MPYKPLTKEQFEKARQAGYTFDQIVKFEKQRKIKFEKPYKTEQIIPTETTVKQQIGLERFEPELSLPEVKSIFGISRKPYMREKLRDIYSSVGVETGDYGAKAIGRSTIAGTGRDINAILAHFVNQLLLNQPREIFRALKLKYPEEITAPTAKIIARGAGIAGIMRNPLLRGITRGRLPLRTLKSAILGAAYAPKGRDITDIKERIPGAIIGGILPPALYGAGKMIRGMIGGTGRLTRGLANLTTKTAKWIKQRGPDKIFTPAKESVDYIKSILAPYAQKIYEKTIQTFPNSLQGYAKRKGITQTAIDIIKKRGVKTINAIRNKFGDTLDDIAMNIDNALERRVTEAGNMMNDSLRKIKAPAIKTTKTFTMLQTILKKYNLIDESGFLMGNVKDRPIPPAMRILIDMYSQIIGESTKIKGLEPLLPKGLFRFYREALRKAQKGTPSISKDVQRIVEGLYDDAANAGAKGIQRAKQLYKIAIRNYDDYFGKFGQRKLDRYLKFTEVEKRALKEIEKKAKIKIINDIEAITASRELDKLGKMDEFTMGKLLESATNLTSHKAVKKYLKPFFGEYTDEIFNNIRDHVAVREISTTGQYPLGRVGILSKMTRKGLREYYEKAYPTVETTKKEFLKGLEIFRRKTGL